MRQEGARTQSISVIPTPGEVAGDAFIRRNRGSMRPVVTHGDGCLAKGFTSTKFFRRPWIFHAGPIVMDDKKTVIAVCAGGQPPQGTPPHSRSESLLSLNTLVGTLPGWDPSRKLEDLQLARYGATSQASAGYHPAPLFCWQNPSHQASATKSPIILSTRYALRGSTRRQQAHGMKISPSEILDSDKVRHSVRIHPQCGTLSGS